jgi:MATE family multidrug resistance protein
MDGVFIGATWSRDMRNRMLMSFAGYLAGSAVSCRSSAITASGWR